MLDTMKLLAAVLLAIAIVALGVRLLSPLLCKATLEGDGTLRFLLFRFIPIHSVRIETIVQAEAIGFGRAVLRSIVRPGLGWVDRPWKRLVWMVTETGFTIVVSPDDPERFIERVRRARADWEAALERELT